MGLDIGRSHARIIIEFGEMNFKFSLNVITMCGFLLLLWRTLVSRRNFYTMYVVESFELQSFSNICLLQELSRK
jgi:hypothetical protein